MSKSPEPLSRIFVNNNRLAALSQRSRQLSQLNHILHNILPSRFSEHCQLANLNETTVVILCDQSSYASMLRFQSAQICKALSEQTGLNVQQLELKVRPFVKTSRITGRNQLELSKNSAKSIEQTASGIEDGALKTALNQLAKRCRQD
ncbi:hypothetical protein MPL1_05669 [Methylophaga lonarensis MPL]|uniref:DUF721 domain-containing protein n=1 Tax=Methylophaga lonarensis MPL TaxID=1286106 RepID=M7P1J2_9GAMM|nr:DciA family protein [Methylophaga lonarensis]EMR13351.1 hypothetical protein MPL1_05669 [Methylophaga lonarensis MPL]